MNYRQLLQDMKDEYNKRLGQKQQIENDKTSKEKELSTVKANLQDVEFERTILQKTADNARESAKTRLEATMTTALQHIFGNKYSAEIQMTTLAGKPAALIWLVTHMPDGSVVKTEPKDSNGGGIVDIISIALRIAMIQLHNDPPINGPIILDEPGKHVSANFSTKLSEFLKFISQQFGKQIIFVTHNDDLKSIADKSYLVYLDQGASRVVDANGLFAKGGLTDVEMPF